MSGLSVIVGEHANRDAVEQMLAAASYRGSLHEIHVEERCALGVQVMRMEHPFASAAIHVDGRVLVAFTGCLYRGPEIVSGKEAAERLAVSYLDGGSAELAGLSGSYAAVLVDPDRQTAVGIRTPVGERPLFWRFSEATLILASDIASLVVTTPRPSVEEDAVLDLVAGRPGDRERTTYRGIWRLEHGGILEWDGRTARRRRTWDPRPIVATARISRRDAVEELRARLQVAVGRRLREGTGLLLSGGFDSSSIAAEAGPLHRARYDSPLRVLSASYPDFPAVDETDYVRLIAEALELEVAWVRPQPDAFSGLDRRIAVHGAPDTTPMSWNFEQILDAGREAGFDSLMDGHEGDPIFGVRRGLPAALLRRGRVTNFARQLAWQRRWKGVGYGSGLKDVVATLVPGARRLWRRLRRSDRVPGWVTGPLRDRILGMEEPDGWEAATALLAGRYLPAALEALERLALSRGLVVLHPLADLDLLDFALRLPPEVKHGSPGLKRLAALAYPGLPREVLGRHDRTSFDDFFAAGAAPQRILEESRRGPRILPGIDWGRLERRLAGGRVDVAERMLLMSVLSADRFLGSS